VVATKLFVPARRRRLVARGRLIERLDEALEPGHRLTLVSAPPGFGKTTLVADWLAHLAGTASDVRVAWVSLDEGDNDVGRLLAHVLAAFGDGLGDLSRAGPEPGIEAASLVTALVNRVAGERVTWILVLDDYHVVEATEVNEAVAFLLDHLPDNLHLVLATRSDPVLPVARLRSRGQLTEVRAADLRFTGQEAAEFLNTSMELSLGAADVAALDRRTEGWAAGLQLAGLSLRGVSDPDAVTRFITAFTGSNRFVIDYLVDEVLARQPAPVRDFLMDTSVLDRLTGDLCDAVTGRGDGTRMLDELDRVNLFLVPLDAERRWYRYHHLFADVLRSRSAAERPDRAPVLHLRAAEWFAGHGLAADAVRHALAAGDVERAARLIEEALADTRRSRQDSLLLSWIRALPDPVVRSSPVLSITAAWAQLMAGQIDAAGSRLDDAEKALATTDPAVSAAWADTEDLRMAPATVAVYRASLAQARGDVPGTVRHSRRALELAGPQDHLVRGAAGGFLGLAAWAAGDVRQALSTFGDAVRHLHAAGNLVDELDSTIPLADMWIASGRPNTARRLYEQALTTATTVTTAGGAPSPRAVPDLHVGLAELDRELGDLTGARERLEIARRLAEGGSITENRHRWFVAMAQVHAAEGDHGTATGLLGEAEVLFRHGFYPDVRPIPAIRARMSVHAGDLAAADAWAGSLGADLPVTYLREYEHLTLVRLRLAQDRRTGVAELLGRLSAAAAADERGGSLVEISALQALVHQAEGDDEQALAMLARSFTQAPEPGCRVRLYLDEGAPMLGLLERLAGGHDPASVEAARVLAVVARGEPGRAREREPEPGERTGEGEGPEQVAGTVLSRRELQVLRLLDSELTGPEIARELYVTVNTLRTHTKRIFTKLDVTTRAAAVRRARERGLL
jgi:LuxR family maltose regulon positive regulatory protein